MQELVNELEKVVVAMKNLQQPKKGSKHSPLLVFIRLV